MSMFASSIDSFSVMPKGMILVVCSGWCVVDCAKAVLVMDVTFGCVNAVSGEDWLIENIRFFVESIIDCIQRHF